LAAAVPDVKGARAILGMLVPSVRFYGNEDNLASELLKTRDLVRSRLGIT
jgi:hypothetical protein